MPVFVASVKLENIFQSNKKNCDNIHKNPKIIIITDFGFYRAIKTDKSM